MWILNIFACGARSARGSTPSTPVFEKFWHGGWVGAKFFNNHVFIVPPIGFLHEKTNVANRPKQKPMSSTGFYTPWCAGLCRCAGVAAPPYWGALAIGEQCNRRQMRFRVDYGIFHYMILGGRLGQLGGKNS